MNRKVVLFLLILIGICAISHAGAADISDASAPVNSSDVEIQAIDDTDVVESPLASDVPAQYGEIQERIDNAKDGDTINLSGEYVCDYVIIVNKPVTLKGIDGMVTIRNNVSDARSTPFFYVNASNVVLENIRFIGSTFHFGGAITWKCDDGLIDNCQFIDNAATGDVASGGALLMYGNNCRITNSTFANNHADVDGGAIAWYGDGGTISGCRFDNNEATGDGARYSEITGDPFSAKGWGGALVIWANNCNVTDCVFTNNRATNYGGAIGLANDTNRIKNCSFIGNYISSDAGYKYYYSHSSENYTFESGGAIFSSCFYLVIDNCTFKDNHADKTLAGAISLAKYDTVINSFFKDNVALKDLNIYSGDDIFVFNNTGVCIDSNEFVLGYKNPIMRAVYGMNVTALNLTNEFIKTKMDSRVDFVAGMIFTYGESGTSSVFVEGGSVGKIEVLNHPEALISYSEGTLTVSGLDVGKYTLRVSTVADEDHNPVDGDLSITVNPAPAVIKATKTTVALKKAGSWTATIVDPRTGKGIANMQVTLKIYTGNKVKTVNLRTNGNGVVSYKTSGLTKGSHKVVVSATHAGYTFVTLTSSIKVVKQTAMKFKVKKKTLSDGASLSIIVQNKKTKKPVNGVKVRLLIYTGSKLTKTVILKTKTYKKNKGVVGYSTNQLSVGKHKVKIEFVDVKYGGTAKSSMKITKKAKKYPAATFKISAKV